jgi:hypothetical protein
MLVGYTVVSLMAIGRSRQRLELHCVCACHVELLCLENEVRDRRFALPIVLRLVALCYYRTDGLVIG